MWQWNITDIITTPRYWFIPCIMIYYAIYPIRKYMFEHLKITFLIASTIADCKLFYDIGFKQVYHVLRHRIHENLLFSFYAIRAIQLSKRKMTSPQKSFIYILLSLTCYYACMGIYKISPFYCKISNYITYSITNLHILDVSVL